MEAEFRNPGGNYLSAGDALLPSVYLFFDLAFLVAAIAWVRFLRSNEKHVSDLCCDLYYDALIALKLIDAMS
jgi:hypothetical protein